MRPLVHLSGGRRGVRDKECSQCSSEELNHDDPLNPTLPFYIAGRPVARSFVNKSRDVTMKSRTLRIAVMLLLASSRFVAASTSAGTVDGRVVGVSDGDTITVVDGEQTRHKIRLAVSVQPPHLDPGSRP